MSTTCVTALSPTNRRRCSSRLNATAVQLRPGAAPLDGNAADPATDIPQPLARPRCECRERRQADRLFGDLPSSGEGALSGSSRPAPQAEYRWRSAGRSSMSGGGSSAHSRAVPVAAAFALGRPSCSRTVSPESPLLWLQSALATALRRRAEPLDSRIACRSGGWRSALRGHQADHFGVLDRPTHPAQASVTLDTCGKNRHAFGAAESDQRGADTVQHRVPARHHMHVPVEVADRIQPVLKTAVCPIPGVRQ